MFGDDEAIRSDKDLSADCKAGMERQDEIIKQYQQDNAALLVERNKILCDMATLRRITQQQDRIIAMLIAEVARLKTWVPHPSEMSGWDDPCCHDDTAAVIREACEIHGVDVPEHLIETS